jgi:hypothetical protein
MRETFASSQSMTPGPVDFTKRRKNSSLFLESSRDKRPLPRSKGASRGIKHKGSLTRLGYYEHESADKRRRALNKAVRKFGYKKTQDKLVALEVLNKNRNPEFSDTVKADMNYLRIERPRKSDLRNR